MSKKLQATFIRAVLAMAVLAICWGCAGSASAQEVRFGFEDESQNAAWNFEGGAGIDRGMGLAYEGQNNAWIRASYGWNSLYRYESTGQQASECVVLGYVRMTKNLTGLYFSIIDSHTGAILSESAWRGDIGNGGYLWVGTGLAQVHPHQQLIIRVGFWGNGQDAWTQVDELELICS